MIASIIAVVLTLISVGNGEIRVKNTPYSHLFKIMKARFPGCIGTKPWYCYQVWVPYELIIHQNHFTITVDYEKGKPIDVTYDLSRKWELKGVWFNDYKVTLKACNSARNFQYLPKKLLHLLIRRNTREESLNIFA
jgi:hypothetical protein